MTWFEWYDSLAKPSWTPAPATISLIWMILYPVIVASFVFGQAIRKKLPGGWRCRSPSMLRVLAGLQVTAQ
jgi:benzodiazapine receptor